MKDQKGFIPVIIILVAAILITIGYYVYRSFFATEMETYQLSSTPIPSSTITENEWETTELNGSTKYKNFKYNFELSFPKSWIYESPAYGGKYLGGGSILGNSYFVLGLSPLEPDGDYTILVTIVDLPLDKYIGSPYYGTWAPNPNYISEVTEIKINNLNAHKILYDNNNYQICFDLNNATQLICFDGSGSKDFDRILSTFKFIE